MAKCIIHIGMHKTGSSSIQNSLEGFSNDHFLYANLGPPNHSLAIASLFTDNPLKFPQHFNKSDTDIQRYIDRAQNALEATISSAQDRTLIISGEGISTRLDYEGLVRLRDSLLAYFDNIEIIGYIRSPASYMTSAFQQKVKRTFNRRHTVAEGYCEYLDRFEKFDKVFGVENVRFKKFAPNKFLAGCVVQDFCTELRVPLTQQQIIRQNESMSKQIVSMLYTYNSFRGMFGFQPMRLGQRRKLCAFVECVDFWKLRFSPDMFKPVLTEKHSDIQWMENRLGESLEEELDGDQPGDICSETELLIPDEALVRRLFDLLGENAPEHITGESPEDVAQLVHAVRKQLSARHGT